MDAVIRGEISDIGSISGEATGIGSISGDVSVVSIDKYSGPYEITLSEQEQTLETNGKKMMDDITVEAIAPPFYNMSGDMAWLGAGAELVQTWTLDNKKLSQTDFASWTPSTTAKDILATRTAGTFVADMANYDYYLIWKTGIPFVVDSSAAKKALPILTASYQVQQLTRRPNTWAQIEASTFATNICVSAYTQNFMRYYGTTTGSATYSWGVSYGIYATVTAATFSNSTSDTPTVTVKSPKVSARCSTSYMSTANAALIDQDKTVISQTCYVYRVKKGTSFMRGIYQENTKFINEVK